MRFFALVALVGSSYVILPAWAADGADKTSSKSEIVSSSLADKTESNKDKSDVAAPEDNQEATPSGGKKEAAVSKHSQKRTAQKTAEPAKSGGNSPASGNIRQTGATATAATSKQQFHLKYHFAPQQTVHYEVTHNSTMTTRKGETSEIVKWETKTRNHYRVVSVDNDRAGVLESHIDQVQMSAQFGENDAIVYDSSAGVPPPPQFRGIGRNIGKPLGRIKTAANGKLLEAIPLKRQAAEPGNRERQNYLVVLPKEPIAVGETWSNTYEVTVAVPPNLKQKVTLVRKYTLDSVVNGQATIQLKTGLLTPINDPGICSQLIQHKPQGTIQFDLNRGLITSRILKINTTEIGFAGADSSLRFVSRRDQQIVPEKKLVKKPSANGSSSKQ